MIFLTSEPCRTLMAIMMVMMMVVMDGGYGDDSDGVTGGMVWVVIMRINVCFYSREAPRGNVDATLSASNGNIHEAETAPLRAETAHLPLPLPLPFPFFGAFGCVISASHAGRFAT